MYRSLILILIVVLFAISAWINRPPTIKLALLKYNGGGDWYANPTALPNLAIFCNKEIKTNLDDDYATIEAGSAELFNYPFLHMTGHGNVVFNDMEAENLRNYLIAGGFLHIDDNYGMDPYVRPVSYTHLDVYKRQILYGTRPGGICSKHRISKNFK